MKRFIYGMILFFPRYRPIRFEVWDRDNKWDDNCLGVVNFVPLQGVKVKEKFGLKHGTLFVSITAICGPSLQGHVCERYAPSPGAERLRHTWTEEAYGAARHASLL